MKKKAFLREGSYEQQFNLEETASEATSCWEEGGHVSFQ
jgi:hypothetical protein